MFLSAASIQLIFIVLTSCLCITLIFNLRDVFGFIREMCSDFRGGLWGWLLLFVAMIRIRGNSVSGSFILDNYAQLVLVLLSVIVIFISLLRNYSNLPRINSALFFLLVYSCTGLLSGVYSPKQLFSAYKALLLQLVFLEVLLLLSYYPLEKFAKKFIELTFVFYLILVMSYVTGAILYPSYALIFKPGMIMGMLKGIFIKSNPNTVGVVSGVLSLLAINRFFSFNKLKHKLLIVCFVNLFLFVLIVAQSRTCIVAFICSLMLMLFLRRKYFLLLIIIFLGLGVFSVQSFSGYKKELTQYYKRGQSDKTFQSWSGRKDAWLYSLKKFKESPVLGYGMGAGVRFGSVMKHTGSHLHSSYFEVLLDSGLLGFIPWLLGLFCIFKKIILDNLFLFSRFKEEAQELHVEMVVILTFFLIRSVAGTTFVTFDYTYMIYVCMIVYSYFLINSKKLLNKEVCSYE